MRANLYLLIFIYSLSYFGAGTFFGIFFELNKKTVDGIINAINSNSYNQLIHYLWYQLWAVIVYSLEKTCNWLGQLFGRITIQHKRSELLKKVFKDKNQISWEWYVNNFSNEKLFTIINNDVEQATNSYNNSILKLVSLSSFMLPIFVFFFLTNFLLGIYILFFILFANLTSLAGREKLSSQAFIMKEKNAIFVAMVNNYLDNLQILSLKKQIDLVYKKFIHGASQEKERTNLKNSNIQQKISLLSNSLVDLLIIAVTITSSYLIVFRGTLTIGSMLAITGALLKFTPHTKGIIDALRQTKETKTLFSKIVPPTEDFSMSKNVIFKENFTSIKVENLSFKAGDKYLFKNLNFVIEKGKKYGLIGPSGCGKTTLLKLITGMARNYEGMIFVNNINIKQIPEQQTRNLFFLLSTPNLIFCVSPSENITLFEEGPNHLVKDSLTKVNLLKFQNSTIDSTKLSEGEKKRLGIARSFASNKEVLIYDEPWNNLDLENRRLIEKNLLNTHKTTIIASHHIVDDTFFDYLFILEEKGLRIRKCKTS